MGSLFPRPTRCGRRGGARVALGVPIHRQLASGLRRQSLPCAQPFLGGANLAARIVQDKGQGVPSDTAPPPNHYSHRAVWRWAPSSPGDAPLPRWEHHLSSVERGRRAGTLQSRLWGQAHVCMCSASAEARPERSALDGRCPYTMTACRPVAVDVGSRSVSVVPARAG